MADTIQIRAGNKANMPKLADRELGYVRDEKALYIGTAGGNVKLCDADLEGTVNKLGDTVSTLNGTVTELGNTVTTHGETLSAQHQALEGKLTARKVAAQGAVSAEADLAAVVAGFNNLIAAMKSSGVMNT